jgi:hypothetical protein
MKPLLRILAVAAALSASASISIAESVVTVYKSPGCGCCEKWIEHLRDAGFKVQAEDRTDLDSIRQKAGVPPEMAACHTAKVDGYAIEGHVPAAAIRRLLRERPATRGLSVPGMPQNSPGMGEMNGKLQTLTLEGRLFSTN